MRRLLLSASLVAVGWLHVSAAQAAAPGTWHIGVERMFGFKKATLETDAGPQETSASSTSVSLLSRTLTLDVGYPDARLALDYILPSGVSLGGAIGYESVDYDDDDDTDNASAWLLAPRVGYFASVTSGFGLWPRGGFTFLSADDGDAEDDDDISFTALTVEVPLVFNLGLSSIGLTVMPYIDFGLGGGNDDVDMKLTEFGLQFGMSAFF
ncbi:MAG: hypothetical protein RL685_7395 [Pseudomonadota bacterium]|jgi:hypothetical protein